MFIHLSAISLLTLVAFVQASDAQNTSRRVTDLLPEGLRVEEIVEDSMKAVVRGSLVQADGTVLPGQVIICERGNPELSSGGQATLIWQDYAARTDDATNGARPPGDPREPRRDRAQPGWLRARRNCHWHWLP